MLTTDDYRKLDEYVFKNSPESCSDNSYSTDFNDVLSSDEDFLQQLSSDLNIPLLLSAGEDEMNLLNSFFDKSPDEIMAEIAVPSPPEIEEQFNEFQQMDLTTFNPAAFPNLIKSESDSDSSKSHSPVQMFYDVIKDEIKIEPPASPPHVAHFKVVHSGPGAPHKRPIQPKTPFVAAAQNKVVLLKNVPPPKVVVLEPLLSTTTTISGGGAALNVNTITTTAPVIVNRNNNGGISLGHIDPKLLKRQQRKIKNRESACLSRKKKKDYLTSLENQVKQLSVENQKLKLQNMELNRKLSRYEECTPKNVTKSAKNSLVLCIFLLVVGFNLDYIRKPFLSNNQMEMVEDNIPPNVLVDHHGRSLLWAEEPKNSSSSANLLSLSMCPAAINQTETARLRHKLEKWIGKRKIPPLNVTNVTNITSTRSLRKRRSFKKKFEREETLRATSRMYSVRNVRDNGSREIQVFSAVPDQSFSDFYEAINRQNDTYYVVSFSEHHMLLPALSHNKTSRLKMSLIMPSMFARNTSNTSHPSLVPLMQFDCEVLDMRLIEILYGVIPQHLRAGANYSHNQQANEKSDNVSSASENARKFKGKKPFFVNDDTNFYNNIS